MHRNYKYVNIETKDGKEFLGKILDKANEHFISFHEPDDRFQIKRNIPDALTAIPVHNISRVEFFNN